MLTSVFHAHFTIDRVEAFDPSLLEKKFKVTIIDLENSSKGQRDFMLTRYYKPVCWEDRAKLISEVKLDAEYLSKSGLKVLRTKLECLSRGEGMLSDDEYLEVHIKIDIPPRLYKESINYLRELGLKLGFVLSRNPYSITPTIAKIFANMRFKSGLPEEGVKKVDALVEILKQDFNISSLQIERVVYDSNYGHDSWRA
jgi:hypothetical protein